jgi:invasion protein IalB
VHKIGPRNLLLLVTGSVAFSASAAAEEAFKLPGGASSLQVTYQDWSLSCLGTPKVICTISQQQTQKDGRRVLAVELGASDEAVSGTLLLPFGLHLDVGTTLQIDDAAALKPLRFSTCLPAGCLVPLSFDANTVAALRAGSMLHVKAQSIDARELTFSISLKGFDSALERLKALVRA